MEQNFHQKLNDHLEDRGWTPEDIQALSTIERRSNLLSSESILRVLQYQQLVEDRLINEDYNRFNINETLACPDREE